MTQEKTALIIGAGPAGLTAAWELLNRTNIKPIVFEKDQILGGISKTLDYKGNKIDIGGHRFFSKSDRVLDWWLNIFPMGRQYTDLMGNKETAPATEYSQSENHRDIFLIRNRKSRIYYLKSFFDYPISLNGQTMKNLGLFRIFKIAISYLKSMLFPIHDELNLEEFLINRFGRELYKTFFKGYTEKVWGLPCHLISAEWGNQRIKGLSIYKAIVHFFKGFVKKKIGMAQKNVETSLIEQFLYPKYGPGHFWEKVAAEIQEKGGTIITEANVKTINTFHNNVVSLDVIIKGETKNFQGDYVFSTMPLKEFINKLSCNVPENVIEVANGLVYRDFITIGLLLNDLKIKDKNGKDVTDNWIYIQEPDVKLGRLQIFNNWSPYMVTNPETKWIGLEYFCNENDSLWELSDSELKQLGINELEKINIIDSKSVIDGVVIRVEKSYPAYFGTYNRINELREFTDSFENLFLVGRNGMHKYNNQDHSMETAMTAVDNIELGIKDKANIWSVNTESGYHEEKE